MGKIIAFTNRKGGTAKTTTVANLGVVLAAMGKKVLLVDLDPQANLSFSFGHNPFNFNEPNIYELFFDRTPINNLLHPIRDNLWLVTSDDRLDDIREYLVNKTRREDYLRHALQSIKAQYDFILIDCNPSTDILTINAFSAADQVIIPMACEYLAMAGVSQLLVKVKTKGKEVNPDIEVMGVLLTRYDTRTKESKAILDETKTLLSKHFRVFDTFIREGVKAKEAPRYSQPVVEYSPTDRTSDDYRLFAKEFLQYV